jgi:hypothetical protein
MPNGSYKLIQKSNHNLQDKHQTLKALSHNKVEITSCSFRTTRDSVKSLTPVYTKQTKHWHEDSHTKTG